MTPFQCYFPRSNFESRKEKLSNSKLSSIETKIPLVRIQIQIISNYIYDIYIYIYIVKFNGISIQANRSKIISSTQESQNWKTRGSCKTNSVSRVSRIIVVRAVACPAEIMASS